MHNNAAGCGIKEENLEAITQKLNERYKNVSKEPLFYVDYIWGMNEINQEVILCIAEKCATFWGQEIPESKIGVTDIDLSKCQLRLCGSRNNTLRMITPDGTVFVKFGIDEEEFERINQPNMFMNCLCSPERNEWMGSVSGEFIIDEYEANKHWVF